MSTWSLSDASAQKQLERAFSEPLNIDFAKPGFCDEEPFLNAEQDDARLFGICFSFDKRIGFFAHKK